MKSAAAIAFLRTICVFSRFNTEQNSKKNILNKSENFQPAFTLAEMMVVMLILSIILAAMAPVMTTRNKLDQSSPWQWSTNGSDAYFVAGTNSSQTAMIGQNEVNDTDPAARLIINSNDARDHMLFKNGNNVLGKLSFNNNGMLLGRTQGDVEPGQNAIGIGYNLGTIGNGSIAIGDINVEGSDSIGIGSRQSESSISGSSSIGIGQRAAGSGTYDVAIGIMVSAIGDNSTAIGTSSYARDDSSVAIGDGAEVTLSNDGNANGGVAIGHGVTATAYNSTAIGVSNGATGTNSVAVGHSAFARSSNTIAIGNVSVNIEDSIAIGNGNTVMGVSGENNSSGFIVGTSNVSAGSDTIVLGHSSASLGNDTIAIGHSASASEDGAISIGTSNTVKGLNSIALGRNITIDDDYDETIAIGNGATIEAPPAESSSVYAIAIGSHSEAAGDRSIAIGGSDSNVNSANATGAYSIAIGGETNSSGTYAISLGSGVNISGISAIGIGNSIVAEGESVIAIGRETKANGNGAIAIGHNVDSAGRGGISIGKDIEVTEYDNDKSYASVAIGYGLNTSNNNSIVIGMPAPSDDRPTAYPEAGNSSLAIGSGAIAQSENSVVIGDRAWSTGYRSVAVGNGAEAKGENNLALGFKACRYATGRNVTCVGANAGPSSNSGVSNVLYLGTSDITVQIPGSLYVAKDFNKTSDRRLKYVGSENTSGLDKIKQLKVFNYTLKKDENKTPHVGVIAQDLQKVFPAAVKKGLDGFLSIRFEDMFYAMINAIKELDSRLTVLEKENQHLKDILKQVRNDNKALKEQNKALDARLKILENKIK